VYSLRMIRQFIASSLQQELAYRANFYISLIHSLLNLGIGILGLIVIFHQVETVNGWNFAGILALLGVYLIVNAFRNLVISPSLDALAGMGQEVWNGNFDFTLLRPVDTQLLVSFRHWHLFSLIDLGLGGIIVAAAFSQPGQVFHATNLLAFLVTLCAGVAALYAIMLAFTALVFWSPGFVFAWVFDGIFQLARYPVDIYPAWLRLVLTWIIPVGVMTTIPARTLTQELSLNLLAGSVLTAIILVTAASFFFRFALRRYTSASS